MENLGLCVKKTIRKIIVETNFYIQYSEFEIISNDKFIGYDIFSDDDLNLLLESTNFLHSHCREFNYKLDIHPDNIESFKNYFATKFKPIPDSIIRTSFCDVEWKTKSLNEFAKKNYMILDVSEPFMNHEFGLCVANTIGEILDNSNPFYTTYRKYRFLSKAEKEFNDSEKIKTFGDLNLPSENFHCGNSYLESYVFSEDLINKFNPIPNTLKECQEYFEWNFNEQQMLHFAKLYNVKNKLSSVNSLEDFKRHEYRKYKYISSSIAIKGVGNKSYEEYCSSLLNWRYSDVKFTLCHKYIPKFHWIRMEFYIIVNILEKLNLNRDLIKEIMSYVLYREKPKHDISHEVLLLEDTEPNYIY